MAFCWDKFDTNEEESMDEHINSYYIYLASYEETTRTNKKITKIVYGEISLDEQTNENHKMFFFI